MIQEDYCSFEVSKLLKEKGFDYQGFDYIDFEGEVIRQDRPTHQMAMKWLKGKGIECVIIPIWNTIGKQYRSYVLSDLGDRYKDNYDSYSDNISYEEAVEAALKYSLENLI